MVGAVLIDRGRACHPGSQEVSAVSTTVRLMSSRIRSEWGTLAQRGVGNMATPRDLDGPEVRPVWVWRQGAWVPGLMRRWSRRVDGGWEAEVTTLTSTGAHETLVPAACLRPGGHHPDSDLATRG